MLLGKHAPERKQHMLLVPSTASTETSNGNGIIQKDLWRTVVTARIHRRPTRLLKILYQQKYCHLELKGIETGWKAIVLLKIPQAESRSIKKTTQLQICAILLEKVKKDSTDKNLEFRIFWNFSLLDFEITWDIWYLSSFHFLSFGIRLS